MPSLESVLSLVNQGDYKRAKSLCRKICAAEARNANAWFFLGAICGNLAEYSEMEKHLKKAVTLAPDHVTAHYNLGICMATQSRDDEAINSFRRAIELSPDYVPAHYQLGLALWRKDSLGEAINHYEAALQREPNAFVIKHELGHLYHKTGKLEQAEPLLKQVVSETPESVEAHKLLHSTLYDQGKFEEARECCVNVVNLSRDDGSLIRAKTMVPVIMDSVEHIDSFREELNNNIDALLGMDLEVKNPFREIGYTSFQLAYHGRNDRGLQQKLAELYLHACPELAYLAPQCGDKGQSDSGRRIKIGFISRYLRNHSIGKAGRGLISNLSKNKFETTAFFLEPPRDDIAKLIQSCADHAIQLSDDLSDARRQIAEQGIDILFYQDIGMDPFTYFLAFSRLAPVQCTYFGHPVTTGIPNMDYFISTDTYEFSDYRDHYSEKVVLMHDVAAVSYCHRPKRPTQVKQRAHFGFSESDNVYLCPQTLFKFHPEFDEILANILRNDPHGLIILKEGNRKHLANILRDRFARTIPDVAGRVKFLPQQPDDDYMSLIAISDVMLDTIHFGGFTTSLDALVMETPIVTLPSELMRSRHTSSFYTKIGVSDCIADSPESYARTANALAMDKGYRQSIVGATNEKLDLIWEEKRVINEFERLFSEMVATQ